MQVDISVFKDGKVLAVACLTDPSDKDVQKAIARLTAELQQLQPLMLEANPIWTLPWDVRVTSA